MTPEFYPAKEPARIFYSGYLTDSNSRIIVNDMMVGYCCQIAWNDDSV
jgi:hypothetical protein